MGRSDSDTGSFVAGLASNLEHQGAAAADAVLAAQAQVASVVTRIAAVEAFLDVFLLLAAFFVLALALVPFCRPPPLPGRV